MNLVSFAQTFDTVNQSYERINNLIAAIPHCSAGKADVNIPEEFQSD